MYTHTNIYIVRVIRYLSLAQTKRIPYFGTSLSKQFWWLICRKRPIYIYIYTYIYANIKIRTPTHTYTYAHTHTNSLSLTHTHTHTHRSSAPAIQLAVSVRMYLYIKRETQRSNELSKTFQDNLLFLSQYKESREIIKNLPSSDFLCVERKKEKLQMQCEREKLQVIGPRHSN